MLALLVVAGVVIQARGDTVAPKRVGVVVEPALVARAAAVLDRAERATGAEGDVRMARTATEQLSVTHYLAAKGYDAIVGVALDRAIAVEPVAARYPETRLTTVAPAQLADAVAAAAR